MGPVPAFLPQQLPLGSSDAESLLTRELPLPTRESPDQGAPTSRVQGRPRFQNIEGEITGCRQALEVINQLLNYLVAPGRKEAGFRHSKQAVPLLKKAQASLPPCPATEGDGRNVASNVTRTWWGAVRVSPYLNLLVQE